MARLVENLFGALGVELVCLAGAVGPRLLWEDGVRDARLTEQQLLDDGLAVYGVGDGLPDARVLKRLGGRVEAEVDDVDAGELLDLEVRVLLERLVGVGLEVR